MVIIRVKDLNDGLRQILLLNSFLVIALVELASVEGIHRLCIPDS